MSVVSLLLQPLLLTLAGRRRDMDAFLALLVYTHASEVHIAYSLRLRVDSDANSLTYTRHNGRSLVHALILSSGREVFSNSCKQVCNCTRHSTIRF